MKPILVINSGSSSLKYQLVDVAQSKGLLSGLIERVTDHSLAVSQMVSQLKETGLTPGAIGHRVVHGGSRFSAPTVITESVISEIEALVPLAPLHNPGNLAGIRGAMALFPEVTHVAVFDTAFHQSMPVESYRYAIDAALANQYGIRRYGFHGSSHSFVAAAAARFLKQEHFTGIALHLGNGGSACAVKSGKSINTSMGFTPLQGLVMGTRSGDIDPAIVMYLSKTAGMTLDQIDHSLNSDAGLRGLTGDADMRDVTARAEAGDQVAIDALSVYTMRIKHYIGAYLAQLGPIDAIVFTAGVGENAAGIRAQVCSGLGHLGIELDPSKNQIHSDQPRDVSAKDSKIKVLVIPTNEELEIAIQTADLSY